MPEKICLIFDSWSHGNTHYTAVFATYKTEKNGPYACDLLGFGPFEDETSLGTKELYNYLTFTLSIYGKGWENVTALVADNCNVNKSLADMVDCGFVGCCSHRFNLAVQDILKGAEETLNKLNTLMRKFKYLIPAAKLRKHTHLRAVTRNETRWSSVYSMMKRYFEIREYILLIAQHDSEINQLLLSATEDQVLEELFSTVERLDAVTLALQKENISIASVRYLFDEVVSEYPSTKSRLCSSAKIIHDQSFENGLVKLQQGKMGQLSFSEECAVQVFAKKLDPVFDESSSSMDKSIISRAFKRQKAEVMNLATGYDDVRYVLPSSNLCERLFSKAGYAINSRRMATLPSNIESQVFLFANCSYWTIADVSAILYGI